MLKKIFFTVSFFIPLFIFSQDKKTIDSLITLSKTTLQDTSRARAFCLLCYEYSSTDSLQSKEYGEKGLALASKIGFESAKAQCLYNLSVMYSENSDYLSSIECLQKV